MLLMWYANVRSATTALRNALPVLVLVALPAGSAVGAATDGLPLASLYGAYEVIGRGAGEHGELYRGWVRLAIEGGQIEMDRCIDGRHTTGLGREVLRGADELRAIEFRYDERDVATVASCIVTSDFGNLPRFSCYVTPENAPAIAVPGIETYFPIVWPVALDYFDCR